MDAPGGDTVELHARCWMGQGGTTANGYFRVAASTLELGGALECAFPRSLGTFKVKGGAGAYFHGGASAQEQLIPVASLTSKAAPSPKGGAAVISVTFGKKAITNRFFSVTLTMEGDEIFAPEKRQVRLEVIAGKEIIGQAAMAAYGFEEGTKEITLEPSQPNSITLMLAANSFPPMVLIRVTDSKNQSILATLADIPLNLSL